MDYIQGDSLSLYLIGKLLLSALIGTIFGAFWKDNLRKIFSGIVVFFSKISPFQNDINGQWKAEFNYKNKKTGKIDRYIETIEIYSAFSIAVGKIISRTSDGSHGIITKYEKKPVRVIGKFIDKEHIVGTWYHPDKKIKIFGSYQLTLNRKKNMLNGKWIGFSDNDDIICDEWTWKKKQEYDLNSYSEVDNSQKSVQSNQTQTNQKSEEQ